MKRVMFLLLMLVVVSAAFSQKKGKMDPKDTEIDSLTRVNASLTAKLDSISKDREIYYSLYTIIKEKVIKYDFDPSKASELIDSLKTSRESTMFGLTANADSLSALRIENKNL